MRCRCLVALSGLLGAGATRAAAQPAASLPPSPYRNLVMEGGGIRGIAYGGALRELERQGVLGGIARVGGTSAGAIQAALLAVGYSAAEIIAVVNATPVQRLNDGRFLFFGGSHRLLKQYGWYRGDQFARYLSELVARKTGRPNLTLGELHTLVQLPPAPGAAGRFRDLYVTGTNLTSQRTQVFSYETNPTLRVADAVRISMSIPLYFRAVLLDARGQVIRGRPAPGQPVQVLVDGGLLANYPIDLFDQPRYLTAGAGFPTPSRPARSSTPKPWACASTAPSRFRSIRSPPAASSSRRMKSWASTSGPAPTPDYISYPPPTRQPAQPAQPAVQITDIAPFLDYYQRVRDRTRRLLPLVPPDQLEWTYQPGRFTLGDQVRHIAAIERFLYVETVLNRPSRYAGCGPALASGYDATLAFFDRCHAETLDALRGLTPAQLEQKCYPLGGAGLPVWKWLRLLPEHEIHHRGQLYLYLSMLGVETPPLFGLSSEAVASQAAGGDASPAAGTGG